MTSKFVAFFPAANEGSTLENIDHSQRREILRRVFSKLFHNKNVMKKKQIKSYRIADSEKPLKDLENHRRIHRQYKTN